MAGKNLVTTVNRLLRSLSFDEQNKVENNSTIIELRAGDILCESNKSPTYIYFPLSGLISLVVKVDDEAPYALAMIGGEGMLGATAILGITEAPVKGIVQVDGHAVRMTTGNFDKLTKNDSQLQAIVKRYLYSLIMQLNKTAGCSRFHNVSHRLARWLLMTHDRSKGNSFFLTQQFLSEILGVQRSTISIAASTLQTKLFINYARGQITILDRKGLEAIACSCYAATVKDQKQFTSPIVK